MHNDLNQIVRVRYMTNSPVIIRDNWQQVYVCRQCAYVPRIKVNVNKPTNRPAGLPVEASRRMASYVC